MAPRRAIFTIRNKISLGAEAKLDLILENKIKKNLLTRNYSKY